MWKTSSENGILILTTILCCVLFPSVASQEIDTTLSSEVFNEKENNTVLLSDYLDLFSLKRLIEKWPEIYNIQNENCSRDFEAYFQGFQDQKIWAYKMEDASGHYSPGYFDGNNYWMGSLTLCKNIFIDDIEEAIEIEKIQVSRKTGLLENGGYDQNLKLLHSGYYENPTFKPGFFILKTKISNANIAQNPRKVYIGLCLPSSCSNEDITTIVKAQLINDIDVLQCRSPTDERYKLFTDPTFIILVITVIVVVILMAIGTTLEVIEYFKEKDRSKASSKTDVSQGSLQHVDNKNEQLRTALEINGIEVSKEQKSIINPSLIKKMFMAFSVIENFKSIFNNKVGSDTVPCIHGLRTISMCWVILGHVAIIGFKYSQNLEFKKDVERQFLFLTILNGQYAVDTFFFISGFLITFLYFRTNAKGKLDKLTNGVGELRAGVQHFFGLVVFRFVRLTLPYLFVLGVSQVTMQYFEQYSVFEPEFSDQENCPKYWWRNVLYINTFFPVEQMCMVWSWYLANDTQFFVVGVIVLIIAIKHFKIAATMFSGILLAAWATTTYIAYDNKFIPNTDEPLALFDQIYDKPWTRIGPYMIGMFVGWLLFKINCKLQMNRIINVVGWTVAMVLGQYIVYGFFGQNVDPVVGAVWTSLSHSLWAVYIAWVVISCSTGYGGFIDKILSNPVLYAFSRTTYCAYLLHPLVIRTIFLNSVAPIQLGIVTMTIYFFGTTVLSYMLAIGLSLAFEAPCVSLLRLLEGQNRERH